jgi:hypothetical protein
MFYYLAIDLERPESFIDKSYKRFIVSYIPLFWLLEASLYPVIVIFYTISVVDGLLVGQINMNKPLQKSKPTNMNESFFHGLRLYKDIFEAGAVVDPLNLKNLKLVFKSVSWRIAYLSRESTRGTNKIRSMHNFAVMIYRMTKHHGATYTVKYLKACQLAIQKRISGKPFTSLREIEPELPLPRLTRSGLPSFIKLEDRASIVGGSLKVMRFWLSITSSYRVLKSPVITKLNTITDGFGGDECVIGDFERFLRSYILKLLNNFLPYGFHPSRLGADRLELILQSSPSAKRSWTGLIEDYKALSQCKL